MWIILLIFALLLLAPGLLVGALKWLILVAVVLAIASAISYPRRL